MQNSNPVTRRNPIVGGGIEIEPQQYQPTQQMPLYMKAPFYWPNEQPQA